MKQFVLFLSLLFIGAALADSAPTSVGYADSQIGTLQNKISAVNTNTVLTTTNTAGEIGQKSIYDANGNYVEQQNALVTAEVANAAVQNAIDTEFVCTEWLDGAERTNENCLIYTVRNPAPNRILPAGYTQLEYIESTVTQYIDTGIQKTSRVFKVEVDLSFSDSSGRYLIGTASESPNYCGRNSDGKFELNFVDRTQMSSGVGKRVKLEYYSNKNQYPVMKVTKNGTSETLVGGSPGNLSTNTFKIFANTSTDGKVNRILNGKIYYASISMGGELKRNFIPARRDSDGEIGMYDLVSNTFFTNAGTGEFIAGPELNIYLPSGI